MNKAATALNPTYVGGSEVFSLRIPALWGRDEGLSICGKINPMDEALLRERLVDLTIPDLRYFASTGSTNDEALSWAEAGAPDGALVVADEQTSGRGRLERSWVTRPGSALAFSMVFRPTPQEVPRVGLFSPLGALAVCLALHGMGLPAEIKWPNDVLAGGRKLCGILAESVWLDEQPQAVVLGIGINVAPSSIPPADQLNFPATCLEAELSRPVERVDLLAEVLLELFAWRPRLGSPQFLQAWESRLAYRGSFVRVESPGGDLTGKLAGITPDGGLRLITEGDHEIIVLAGDVRLRPAG